MQSILYPFSISQTCLMSFLKLAQKCVLGQTCPGHVPDMSRTCTQNVPVLTILGHLQKCPESICPMSFFYFSNLSHILAQNCLKMCPWPDMSRTRPGRVPDVSSKCPCPDHFGTFPQISWVNLFYVLSKFLKLVLCPFSNLPKNVSPAGHVPDVSRMCPGRVLKMSLSWLFWDISK